MTPLRALGKLRCWWEGRHAWGRAFYLGIDESWNKECTRCGLVRAVKRRKAKEKA